VIGYDDVVSDLAIVSNVGAGHEEIFVADFCDAAISAAAMNRGMLTNHVLVTDFDARFSVWRIRQVLRRRPDNRSVVDRVVRADCDVSFDHNMRRDYRSGTDHNVRANHSIGANYNIRSDVRAWIDDCSRMNFHSTPASLKLK